MANKAIFIGGVRLGYANKAEVTPDITDAEETKTFDGPILDTPESISWEVSIDKLRYATTIQSYKEIEILLLQMFKEKKTVQVNEIVKMADGNEMKVVTKVYNCAITDKKYSIDPESRTVENLTFKGSPMDTWINGEKLPRV